MERFLDQSDVGSWIPALLQYDGPCTLKPWAFLWLSIPEWALICFIVLAVVLASILAAAITVAVTATLGPDAGGFVGVITIMGVTVFGYQLSCAAAERR